MTFIWLCVWLITQTPEIQFTPDTNGWAISLMACVAIDLIGAVK